MNFVSKINIQRIMTKGRLLFISLLFLALFTTLSTPHTAALSLSSTFAVTDFGSSSGSTANAAADACKKESKKADIHGNSRYNACIAGYQAGVNKESKKKTCDGVPYSSVCNTGFDKGKAAIGASGSGDSAQPNPDPNSFDPDLSSLPNSSSSGISSDTIRTIVSIVFGIAGALALLFIVIGGLRYILSAGNPEAASQAKNTILYALVGLIITMAAYGIVAFVISKV